MGILSFQQCDQKDCFNLSISDFNLVDIYICGFDLLTIFFHNMISVDNEEIGTERASLEDPNTVVNFLTTLPALFTA